MRCDVLVWKWTYNQVLLQAVVYYTSLPLFHIQLVSAFLMCTSEVTKVLVTCRNKVGLRKQVLLTLYLQNDRGNEKRR